MKICCKSADREHRKWKKCAASLVSGQQCPLLGFPSASCRKLRIKTFDHSIKPLNRPRLSSFLTKAFCPCAYLQRDSPSKCPPEGGQKWIAYWMTGSKVGQPRQGSRSSESQLRSLLRKIWSLEHDDIPAKHDMGIFMKQNLLSPACCSLGNL